MVPEHAWVGHQVHSLLGSLGGLRNVQQTQTLFEVLRGDLLSISEGGLQR